MNYICAECEFVDVCKLDTGAQTAQLAPRYCVVDGNPCNWNRDISIEAAPDPEEVLP